MADKVRVFQIDGLGLCEHCGVLLAIEDMPLEVLKVWKCASCKREIGHKSFGYDDVNGKLQKVSWVGEDGKWEDKMPKRDFQLGDWYIALKPNHQNF